MNLNSCKQIFQQCLDEICKLQNFFSRKKVREYLLNHDRLFENGKAWQKSGGRKEKVKEEKVLGGRKEGKRLFEKGVGLPEIPAHF